MTVSFQLVGKAEARSFLDLPWHLPLEAWEKERLVEVPRGISRHVVRFVTCEGSLYALKELPRPIAEREYELLGELVDRSQWSRWAWWSIVGKPAAGPGREGRSTPC